MRKYLTEAEYKDIFSPETLDALKSKSKESLQQMVASIGKLDRDKRRRLRVGIIEAEKDYIDELEMLAVQMVKDIYPIVDYANIKIDAHIVPPYSIIASIEDDKEEEKEEDPTLPNFGTEDPEKLKAKRRIINSITQGAAIRGSFGFLLFREYHDQINPDLVDSYNDLLKMNFYGTFDDEDAIAMLLSMLAQTSSSPAEGESEMSYNEEDEQFIIRAAGINFPTLVYEIIKGLYEIIGTEGLGADEEKNKAIINAVDKVSNEPEDLRFGKFIYDAINNLYTASNIEDTRVRELFFAEVYKLSDSEFFPFIDNAINDRLTSAQKRWATNTMKEIAVDLSKDDTGLEDLD